MVFKIIAVSPSVLTLHLFRRPSLCLSGRQIPTLTEQRWGQKKQKQNNKTKKDTHKKGEKQVEKEQVKEGTCKHELYMKGLMGRDWAVLADTHNRTTTASQQYCSFSPKSKQRLLFMLLLDVWAHVACPAILDPYAIWQAQGFSHLPILW